MFSKLKNLLKKTLPSSQPSREPEPKPGLTPPEQSGINPQNRPKEPPHTALDVKKPKRLTKQGLPVFDNHEDLGLLFGVDDEETAETNMAEEAPGKVRPQEARPKQPPRLTKHGFPILDNQSDLEMMMGFENKEKDPPPARQEPGETEVKQVQTPVTRHGIPILQDSDRLFEQETAEDESFEELLYASLGQKNMDVLLHEKQDREKKRKKLTLKQTLKAYPPPQGQLDLHGYRALKAELRVESYLKSAFHNQTHTVNIIVGKGLHSDEGAVLPDVVENKLNQLKKEGLILAYDWDNKRKSRSGAVIVYLNNKVIS